MIAALAVVFALGAAPCPAAVAVDSPCAGVLVPADQARDAIRCVQVDLPSCRAKAARDRALCDARVMELLAVEPVPQPPRVEVRWWPVAVAAVLGVVVGGVVVWGAAR